MTLVGQLNRGVFPAPRLPLADSTPKIPSPTAIFYQTTNLNVTGRPSESSPFCKNDSLTIKA